MTRIEFSYGEFYDVPRQIRFDLDGETYFMQSHFDDDADDYSDSYEVHRLARNWREQRESNPNYIWELPGAELLGMIPLATINLDPTKRTTIDGDAFREWLANHRD